MTELFPRPGVSLDSYSKAATWTSISGAWASGYPVTNLGDLRRPSKVARVTPASGSAAVKAVLAETSKVQCIAVVQHNAPAGATVRARLYADAGLTVLVHDTGVSALWPADFDTSKIARPSRILVTPVPVNCAAVRIDLAGLTGATDIGAIEIAKWWEWPGISPGAEFGLREPPASIGLLGGGEEAVAVDSHPRVYDGELGALAMADAATKGIDFQKIKGLAQPFVFTEDLRDVTSWPYTTFLATNAELPELVGRMYRRDTFQFRFREHVR